MMNRTWLYPLLLLMTAPCFASQSSILDATGMGCVDGEQRSEEARRIAHTDAKRIAAEHVQTFITSNSAVENFQLKEDLIEAYSTAEVRVLSVLSEEWDAAGECITVSINAEVKPATGNVNAEELMEALLLNPALPLTVKVWTNKSEYSPNDVMQIYLKGNKPFYGMLTYQDVNGNILQILPNPNRSDHYFDGGVIYSVPSNGDTFELVVEPPFGKETLSLYASTAPLGEINKIDLGAAFKVEEEKKAVATKTRGLKLDLNKNTHPDRPDERSRIAEFGQVSLEVSVSE